MPSDLCVVKKMEVLVTRNLHSLRVAQGGDKVYKDECIYCYDTPVRKLVFFKSEFFNKLKCAKIYLVNICCCRKATGDCT